jgi:DNA replication protein DnaC
VGTIATWTDLTDRESPRCILLLVGNNGTGKSGLAAGIAQDWVTRERSVLYRRSVQVTAELRAAPYRRTDPADTHPTEAELLAAYQECDLLVLDDLGAEHLSGPEGERVRERLFALLDARLVECKATIVTTNLPAFAMADRLGERLADRLFSTTCAVQAFLATPNLRASS